MKISKILFLPIFLLVFACGNNEPQQIEDPIASLYPFLKLGNQFVYEEVNTSTQTRDTIISIFDTTFDKIDDVVIDFVIFWGKNCLYEKRYRTC